MDVDYETFTNSWNLSRKKKLRGLSPRANYTDRKIAACQRSQCQLFADRGCHIVSVTDPYGCNLGFLDRSRYFFFQVAEWTPFQIRYFSEYPVAPGIEPGTSWSVAWNWPLDHRGGRKKKISLFLTSIEMSANCRYCYFWSEFVAE
jgi:hypothetical protein